MMLWDGNVWRGMGWFEECNLLKVRGGEGGGGELRGGGDGGEKGGVGGWWG